MNLGMEVFFGRRSIRKYKKEKLSQETLEALLKAAMSAPSACAADPWRFVVVREASQLKALAERLPAGKMIATAPVGIVVCGDINVAHDRQLSYMIQDCSAAIENLLLAAHALGLGACWLGVHPRQERMAHIATVLALPEGVIPVCCIALGYPDEFKEPRTRYNGEYVHYERWCRGWRR
jgi:nitroreductase